MKNYLVAYDVGIIKTTQIQLSDDYIPSSDNMKTIKRKIIKNEKPRYVRKYAAPDNCGGYISYTEGNEVSEDKLQIVSVSNLDI